LHPADRGSHPAGPAAENDEVELFRHILFSFCGSNRFVDPGAGGESNPKSEARNTKQIQKF
jgi:hypothetical protein